MNNEFEIEGEGGYIEPQKKMLRDHVKESVENYFQFLEGMDKPPGPTEGLHVYNMVLAEVEEPMIEVVMKHTRHNQTKAANILGLNRGTLRKKLKLYGFL